MAKISKYIGQGIVIRSELNHRVRNDLSELLSLPDFKVRYLIDSQIEMRNEKSRVLTLGKTLRLGQKNHYVVWWMAQYS